MCVDSCVEGSRYVNQKKNKLAEQTTKKGHIGQRATFELILILT